jgi:hypothetical protein
MKKGLLVGIWLLIAIIQSNVDAGPPILTGDPDTPDARHWEINVGFTVEKRSTETLYETPALDMNYGLTDRIQLTFEIPWLVLSQEGERTKGGLGNSSVGVKWRFLDEKTQGLSVSVFPQIEFNNPGSSSADRGLVNQGTAFLLPLEFGKRWGRFAVSAEFGYAVKEYLTDEWSYGLAAGYAVTDRLELLAEIHGTTQKDFENDELVFNIGTRWKLTQHAILLASVGRAFYSPEGDKAEFLSYLGVQFLF